MKKYVFLTEDLYGLTGSQRYVNNKCKFLRENGWEVIVFWNYNIAPIVLEHIKCFDNERYIYHELKFYPSWFSKRGREKVLNRLRETIGDADQIVIESSKLELGAWGELLAKRLHCKHIIFVLTEGVTIQNQATFDYCYAKLMKKEFFNINTANVINFFSKFTTILSPDNYYWSASQGVIVEKYSFPSFDDMPKADFTITHFGRYKKYFPSMLSEILVFIASHPDKSFNFFFLGNSIPQDEIRNSFCHSNCHISFHSEVMVIPKQLFEESDVVIGTAGCAVIASRYMANVIAIDVNTSKPLGLLGRTTLDTNTSSGRYKNDKSVSQWLEALLIQREIYPPLDDQNVIHGYDYQMRFIDKCDYNYIDSTKVNEQITRHDSIFSFLVRIGLFHIVEFFYYKKRGVKVIIR
ncbi:MAG: hypothetical protein IJK20_03460 [Bacteroidales bacterium]|nr:hypothetical protein [Bacteroidales bacterium]